jgi:aspartokinase
VDLVATSHTSTAFTLDEVESLAEVRKELGEFAEVEVVAGLVTVSLVGHGLLQQPGITARAFSVLGETPVHLISQASDVCLSFLLQEDEALSVVRRLHTELIEVGAGSKLVEDGAGSHPVENAAGSRLVVDAAGHREEGANG